MPFYLLLLLLVVFSCYCSLALVCKFIVRRPLGLLEWDFYDGS